MEHNSYFKGARYAWHFYYAVVLVIKAIFISIGVALPTPSQGVSWQ
ncbi:DUF3265 domain-containing protein [Vibrio sp. J1-1]|nr:DUF3265 domain-containing protein [Vibrionaceae bacterium]MCF7483171.1 DUF3265 domain-containing protein [Vibrio sp. J1-1]